MAWYNSSWLKRKAITLTGGSSGAQTDYQVKLTVTYDSDMQSDFDDLRFTKADGTTLLDAWMESYTVSTSAVVWVETDTPANTVEADIYMYYGNSGAVSDWDGAATFQVFDDFEGSAIDTDIWDSTITNVTTSTDQAFQGSKSAKFPNSAELRKTLTHSENIRIKYWLWAPEDTDYGYIALHGDSGSRVYCALGYPTEGEFGYYASGWVDTEQAISWSTWKSIEFNKFNYSTNKFDMYYDDVKIIDVGGQRIGSDYNNVFRMLSQNMMWYLDCFLVAKYVENPATSAFGSEEDAPSVGSPMWYYALLNRRNL